MMQRVERPFAGRTLTIETGRMAKQAAGSALVRFGDTTMLVDGAHTRKSRISLVRAASAPHTGAGARAAWV